MASVTFSDEDMKKVKAMEDEIARLLMKFNESRVEASLVIFALMRCARRLLKLYPENTRTALVGVIKPFLDGAKELPGTGSTLILQ